MTLGKIAAKRCALSADGKTLTTYAQPTTFGPKSYFVRWDVPSGRATERTEVAANVKEVLDEMRSGRLDSFKFEHLVRSVLLGLGAVEARIVARSQDKGADILASFLVAGAFRLLVAVQVKHFQPEPPVGPKVVQQLIQGIEAEAANLGMVATSGTISKEATAAAELYFDQKGIRIELIEAHNWRR